MATDMGKLQKSKNIIWPTIWKRDASREISKGSMIVSCEIMFFANVCSNMIEMKMFVLNGTILQNKISLIECQNQNIFITDKIGGSPSISLETLADQWETVLTSTKRCLHQTVYTENLEDNNSGPCLTGSTEQRQPSSSSSSTRWQWSGSWWSSQEFKESQWKRMHAKVHDRTGQPVVHRSLAKTSDEWHSRVFSFLLQMDRLQLTAVYCNRRRGVKTTPQKTRFRSVNNYEELQGIHMQVTSEYVETLTTELMTQSRTTSTTTCLTWTQTWSMCTLTRTTPEDMWVLFVCSSVVSLQCRPRLIPCTSHCGSSELKGSSLSLTVIAMSHARVEWLSLRPLHLFHFSSLRHL